MRSKINEIIGKIVNSLQKNTIVSGTLIVAVDLQFQEGKIRKNLSLVSFRRTHFYSFGYFFIRVSEGGSPPVGKAQARTPTEGIVLFRR